MSGPDSTDLLNRLTTNEIVEKPVGSGTRSVLTSNKGRIVDILTIYYLPNYLLLLTGPENQKKIIDWIDGFTFGEEVRLEDITSETAMFTVIGPQSSPLLESLTSGTINPLNPYEGISTSIANCEVYVAKEQPAWGQAFNIITQLADSTVIYNELLEKGQHFGLEPIGNRSYEALRINMGIPVYGSELNLEFNPLEVGLWDSISFSKGCYVGQEVVARLNTYEKVKRHLVKLKFFSNGTIDPGTILRIDDKEVGKITSVSDISIKGFVQALGYIRKAYTKPGTEVTAISGSIPLTGEVVCLVGKKP